MSSADVDRIAREERQEGRDKKRFAAEIATACILLVYTVVTAFMWHATKEAANAAKNAADTAAANLVVSERPWVSAGDIGISEPLTFDARGGLMTIVYTLRNTGRSPALHAKWRSKLIALSMTKDMNEEIFERQQALCEPMRNMSKELLDSTIFPGDVSKQGEGIALYPNEIEMALKNRESGRFAHKGYISMALIACVDYQLSFNPEHHQTRYGLMLGIPLKIGFMGDLEPKGIRPEIRLFYLNQSAD